MSEVLVVVEQAGGAVKKVTLEMLTMARELGTPAAVVLGAPGTAASIKDKLAEYGAEKVYVAESRGDRWSPRRSQGRRAAPL